MCKMQKILLGIFLGGVLLGGIGTGVALVEYSSLAYGGEKISGEESLVTREIDYVFVPGEERINIVSGYWADGVEVDDTVPEGVVRYEVIYNKNTVEPTVCSWEAGEAEQEAWEDSEEDIGEAESTGDGESWEEDTAELAVVMQEEDETNLQDDVEGDADFTVSGTENSRSAKLKQTCLELQIRYIHSDFALFMEYKDEILAELKQKKLFDYQVSYVKEVRIRANSKTMPYIRSQSTKYSVYR